MPYLCNQNPWPTKKSHEAPNDVVVASPRTLHIHFLMEFPVASPAGVISRFS